MSEQVTYSVGHEVSTRIVLGHVLDRLREIPDESVQMVWTSPPYWGLRDYGTEPQWWGGDPACDHRLGDLDAHGKRGNRGVSFVGGNEINRAHAGGHASGAGGNSGKFCRLCDAWLGEHGLEPTIDLWLEHEVAIFREVRRILQSDGTLWVNIGDAYAGAPVDKRHGTYKAKDRLLMPAQLALALRSDGWWLRDEIIWHKPNPMPSSVKDRTTPAHEMLYLFSKSARYYFDHAAIKEPADWSLGNSKMPDGWATHEGSHGSIHRGGREKGRRSGNTRRVTGAERGRPDGNGGMAASAPWEGSSRAKRSVWTVTSEPFAGAHFATAPTALVTPCVLAGCPAGGTVLDPFGGSGTTGLVANRLGRNAILIELNPDYAAIARDRLRAGLQRVRSEIPEIDPHEGLPLFSGGLGR